MTLRRSALQRRPAQRVVESCHTLSLVLGAEFEVEKTVCTLEVGGTLLSFINFKVGDCALRSYATTPPSSLFSLQEQLSRMHLFHITSCSVFASF